MTVPSWCPTASLPLNGIFFLEQSEMMARTLSSWEVTYFFWDAQGANILGRKKPLIHAIKWFYRLAKTLCFNASPILTTRPSGLRVATVWRPTIRYKNILKLGECLLRHLRPTMGFLAKYKKLPEIIHAHASYPAGWAAVNVAREFGDIPVVLTEHMGPFPWPSMVDDKGLPIDEIFDAYQNSSKVIAVSSSLAQRIKSLGLTDDISVIPNFVNEDIFSPECGGTSLKPKKQYRLLNVGWPTHNKGTDTLLEGFALLPDKLRNITTLDIAGDSREIAFYKNKSQDLKIASRVNWLGYVPRELMPALYRQCDVFILPSRYETFGVSIVEALLCDKPVIATRCGGPEDIVYDQNGVLIDIDDAHALAKAIKTLLSASFPVGQVRADALCRFSPHVNINKLCRLYTSLY
jgi:glycosyltransferase involved in cell wall biosynthesis